MSNTPEDPYTSDPGPGRREYDGGRDDDPQTHGGPSPDLEVVRGRVLPPAIILIVISILNILLSLAAAGNGLYVCVQGPDELRRKTLEGLAAFPELRDAATKQDKQTTYNVAVGEYLGGGSLWFLLSLVAIVGAVRMMSLRSYGLAVTASILTAIPCVTPCCLLGQGAGIWALIVLMNQDVRTAFR